MPARSLTHAQNAVGVDRLSMPDADEALAALGAQVADVTDPE